MSSTLLDLQRMNLKKMEAAESPQTATGAETPSNEVSIIPSINQSNDEVKANSHLHSSDGSFMSSSTPSSEHMSEDLDEATIISSHTEKATARKPAISRVSRSGASKAESSRTDAKKTDAKKAESKEPPKDALRAALDDQLRVHLMEQLMPQNGKAPVTRLNVEMPEDLHQQLKQHCVRTRTPIKALINALIALYLEAEEEA